MVSAERPHLLTLGNPMTDTEARLEDRFTLHKIGRRGVENANLSAIGPDITAVAGFGHGKIDGVLLAQLPNLKIVANYGVGYDSVDADGCAAKGILVTNTPDVLTDETADTAVALLLMTVRQYSASEVFLRSGQWATKPFPLTPLTLRGRTVGIAGLGRIGKAVARRLEGFGVDLAYSGRSRQEGVEYTYYPDLVSMAQSVDTLLSVLPGTAATHHIINADVLAALGPTGVLINIGRGTVVDEDALIAALNAGTLAAAGLDVFDNEPNVRQDLIDAPNTVLLPHVGSASIHTRLAMGDLLIRNLVQFFDDGRVLTPVVECSDFAILV